MAVNHSFRDLGLTGYNLMINRPLNNQRLSPIFK
jgi:hypothetical protein